MAFMFQTRGYRKCLDVSADFRRLREEYVAGPIDGPLCGLLHDLALDLLGSEMEAEEVVVLLECNWLACNQIDDGVPF